MNFEIMTSRWHWSNKFCGTGKNTCPYQRLANTNAMKNLSRATLFKQIIQQGWWQRIWNTFHNSLTLGVSRVNTFFKENLWMDKFCSLDSLTKKERKIKSFLFVSFLMSCINDPQKMASKWRSFNICMQSGGPTYQGCHISGIY